MIATERHFCVKLLNVLSCSTKYWALTLRHQWHSITTVYHCNYHTFIRVSALWAQITFDFRVDDFNEVGTYSIFSIFSQTFSCFPSTKQRRKNTALTSYRIFTTFLGGWGVGGALIRRWVLIRERSFESGAYSRWSLNRGRRFLTLLAFRVGAYWRWAFIQGWRLFGVGAY